uniref:Uncharacterized protein n=1 Tax=Panagrellus redivivus TaxID=6233 RepID=A0A7E4VQR2_PANRE
MASVSTEVIRIVDVQADVVEAHTFKAVGHRSDVVCFIRLLKRVTTGSMISTTYSELSCISGNQNVMFESLLT